MNILTIGNELYPSDYPVDALAKLSEMELKEERMNLEWEKMHYESVCSDFRMDSSQFRFAGHQIGVINTILTRISEQIDNLYVQALRGVNL